MHVLVCHILTYILCIYNICNLLSGARGMSVVSAYWAANPSCYWGPRFLWILIRGFPTISTTSGSNTVIGFLVHYIFHQNNRYVYCIMMLSEIMKASLYNACILQDREECCPYVFVSYKPTHVVEGPHQMPYVTHVYPATTCSILCSHSMWWYYLVFACVCCSVVAG